MKVAAVLAKQAPRCLDSWDVLKDLQLAECFPHIGKHKFILTCSIFWQEISWHNLATADP